MQSILIYYNYSDIQIYFVSFILYFFCFTFLMFSFLSICYFYLLPYIYLCLSIGLEDTPYLVPFLFETTLKNLNVYLIQCKVN